MAAHRKSLSCGGARSSKNCEYTVHHFVTFLECCKGKMDNDQQGELPLMSELFAFRHPSSAKTSHPTSGFARWFLECHQSSGCENLNYVPVKYKESRKPRVTQTSELGERGSQIGQIYSGSRRHHRGHYLDSGALRMSTRKYALKPSSSFLFAKRDEEDVGGGRVSRADHVEQKRNAGRIRFEDPYMASESVSNNLSMTLDDDEFSLQHWINFGRIRNDHSESGHWDHKLPTNARRLKTAENLTRARAAISPGGDVFELRNRVLRKSLLRKKHLTSSKRYKQKSEILNPLILSSHADQFCAHNHPLASLAPKGPVFVLQGHANGGKKARLQMSDQFCNFCQTGSAVPIEKFQMSGTVKGTWRSTSLSGTSQRTGEHAQRGKQSSLKNELIASKLPGSRWNSPHWRSISENQRKTLSGSTRNSSLCGQSEFSSRKYGSRTNVSAVPERNSLECTQKVQNAEGIKVKPSQTKELTSIEENKTTCVEASEKHASDHTAVSALPDMLFTGRGSGQMQLEEQEQDGLARNIQGGDEIVASVERTRSLSQKYRPKVLKDLIGQNIVAHALSNAISNGEVAPVYLFQGPPGTGKTSAARIFAAALNCLTSGNKKPCGLCIECTAFMSGRASGFWELDAASHNGIGYMKEIIQGKHSSTSGPRYKVIILDECHMFSDETWNALLKLLEEPCGNAVTILITTHPDKLPLTVVARCQKFHFLQIKHSDIVDRLDTVMKLEKLDAEPGALNLIASKSDGSLRDAEIVLDQLSLLEQRITLDTIHHLVGSVSDDELLSLLNMALRSDAVSTVQRTQELVNSGVEPLDLMFQLSALITNILAGSYIPMNTNQDKGCLSLHALSDSEMERLQMALRILSEAEKQLKATPEYRTTWLTAALLHIGPSFQSKSQPSASSTSLISNSATQPILKNKKAGKKRVLEVKRKSRKISVSKGQVSEGKRFNFDAVGKNVLTGLDLESDVHTVDYSCLQRRPTLVAQSPSFNEGIDLHVKSPRNLERLWLNVLRYCRPLYLRQLLQDHGKLLAVSFSTVKVVAHLKIEKQDPKLKDGFLNMCIVNSFKKVLGLPVEVEISLPPALCSARSTHALEASCDGSIMQSTPELNGCVTNSTLKPRMGGKIAELEGERTISDVKLIKSHKCESDLTLNSTSFSPVVFAPRLTQLVQSEQASISSSTFSVGPMHLNGTEFVIPQQQSPNRALTDEAKCPIQTTFDCCLQTSKFLRKLQIETLKQRRQWRGKPMARLHARKYLCDGFFATVKHNNSTQVHSHGEENLVLRSRRKCEGLHCWKSQKREAGKGIKGHR